MARLNSTHGSKTIVMKSILHAAVLGVSVLWLTAMATSSLAQTSPEFRNSKIVLYEKEKGDRGYWTTGLAADSQPLNPERMALRERMMKRRVLEEYAEFLSPLRLPYTLLLFASDCSGSAWDSPYYARDNHYINMCYSFLAEAENNADVLMQIQSIKKLWTPVSREQLIAGLFVGALLHETGHAVFDLLNVPVFGREEDAADFMAAFIALQFGKETARTIIKGYAYYWAYDADQGADPKLTQPGTTSSSDPESHCQLSSCAFSDEHGTPSQRMYNVVCLAYGGDPVAFKDFVDAGWLTPQRAESCAREYQLLKSAFNKTVLPFIDQAQMKKIQARSWFSAEETKEK
jgi:hypothetical protein